MEDEQEHNCWKRMDDEKGMMNEQEPNVFLNVYDILPRLNSATSCMRSKWGIYHTGVQVHDLEVSFGGHDDSSTGVFCAKPRSARGAVFREQLPVGFVDMDKLEFRQAIAEISRKWPGNSYDPFKRNCNHFSDFLCKELTGRGAPPYVNAFTKSSAVRGIFYKCLVPLGRCVERFYDFGSVTYNDDNVSSDVEAGDALGIRGARGINQILVEAATAQKEKANKLFKSGAYEEAQEAYSKAIGYLGTLTRRGDDEDEVWLQAQTVRSALQLNLAACGLKREDYRQALKNCEDVLAMDASNQKALYRRGIALSYLGRPRDAHADLTRVLQSTNEEDTATVRDVRRELLRVRKLLEGELEEDRKLAKRMLGAKE
eukprot:TRINITY_DN15750_c0_g2_i1.p1 TRINITY_DN15750_c0_g2~~TRINITY_DN15750_c0_g2_i1.p1  ORF type:complete len:371 (+),score=73.87 TRINITY_DN15750_c0_g2_i1:58-1170(+)